MYLRNAWYMAGWDSDFVVGVPRAQGGARPDDLIMDVYTSYDFLVPGIFLQLMQRRARGSYELDADARPTGTPIFETFTCQAITPLTDTSACYFFA